MEWEWHPFSATEIHDTLSKCSNLSAPGPDHMSWYHVKRLCGDSNFLTYLFHLADACIEQSYWPSYFKESVSIVIPKPNKSDYSTPKSLRPIVLLNTLGKLIEKLISMRMHFECGACHILHP